MEEKIKIYIPDAINNILLKDMELFEFYKNDGTFNKNEFYNTLITNYHEQYQESQSSYFNYIKKVISDNTNAKEIIINDITSKILEYVDMKTNQLEQQRSQITLSIKPTKKSSDTFDFIQNYCLESNTLSSYFRNMFASYTLLPQDKRERIIFKENVELIEKALKDKRKVYCVTINNDNPHIVSPYSISNSKEELFNYLLGEYNNLPYSFRISRLRKIKILNEPSNITNENIDIFKKMEEQGPQYSYESNKQEQIKVLMSDKGKQMYKSIYLHRPKCSKIEGDYYFFDCSYQQAYQYFTRLGKQAIVVEPLELAENIQRYYSMGSSAYNKFLKDNSK